MLKLLNLVRTALPCAKVQNACNYKTTQCFREIVWFYPLVGYVSSLHTMVPSYSEDLTLVRRRRMEMTGFST
jgi:hypothetical protein